ncbi:MAG: hypothetical protein OHK0029_18550 [Armatimonadaceae bacterium]
MKLKPSFVPIAVLPVVLLLTMGLLSRLVLSANPQVQSRGKVTQTEETMLQFARVNELIEAGQTEEAKRILDRIGGEKITVESYTSGRGALKVFAPTTILMKLGRLMTGEAEAAAHRGDQEEALIWIARCRELAAQVLAAEEANLDVLNTAHYLDTRAGTTEVAVRELLGDDVGAKRVALREQSAREMYRADIMTRLEAMPNNDIKQGTAIVNLIRLYQNERLQVMAMNSDIVPTRHL